MEINHLQPAVATMDNKLTKSFIAEYGTTGVESL